MITTWIFALTLAAVAPTPADTVKQHEIINNGACEDECEEFLPSGFTGSFGAVGQRCKIKNVLSVGPTSLVFADGRSFVFEKVQITKKSVSLKDYDDTWEVKSWGDGIMEIDGSERASGQIRLDYNTYTSQLTVWYDSSTLLGIYIRCAAH